MSARGGEEERGRGRERERKRWRGRERERGEEREIESVSFVTCFRDISSCSFPAYIFLFLSLPPSLALFLSLSLSLFIKQQQQHLLVCSIILLEPPQTQAHQIEEAYRRESLFIPSGISTYKAQPSHCPSDLALYKKSPQTSWVCWESLGSLFLLT